MALIQLDGYGTDTGPRGLVGWEDRWVNSKGHRFNTDLELSILRQSLAADYNIRRGDVLAALANPGDVFDLILLDPPYDLHPVSPTLEAAAACLSAGGLLVLERATRREPDVPAMLTRVRDVKSGDSTLTFLSPL